MLAVNFKNVSTTEQTTHICRPDLAEGADSLGPLGWRVEGTVMPVGNVNDRPEARPWAVVTEAWE